MSPRSLCFLDWDQTVCPSLWLQDEHCLLPFSSSDAQLPHLPSAVHAVLQGVDEAACCLLKELEKQGCLTVIVTAASYLHVVLSAAAFLPNTLAEIRRQRIQVISVASAFERSKTVAYETIFDHVQEQLGRVASCLSVGDSAAEEEASHALREARRVTVIHVKVPPELKPGPLATVLRNIAGSVETLVTHRPAPRLPMVEEALGVHERAVVVRA